MPSITPMSWMSARSRNVPTPSIHTATTMSATIGNAEITEVEMERTTVWLTARFASSAYVERRESSTPEVFSRTLSNTITVSYSENVSTVSKPMIIAGVTSSPKSA